MASSLAMRTIFNPGFPGLKLHMHAQVSAWPVTSEAFHELVDPSRPFMLQLVQIARCRQGAPCGPSHARCHKNKEELDTGWLGKLQRCDRRTACGRRSIMWKQDPPQSPISQPVFRGNEGDRAAGVAQHAQCCGAKDRRPSL